MVPFPMGIDQSPLGITKKIHPRKNLKLTRLLFTTIIMTALFFMACKTDCSYFDPVNGHDNIIKKKITSGTKILYIGDSITDNLYSVRNRSGSWVDIFSEYTNTIPKNIAVNGSSYNLYRQNADGISIKHGTVERINLDDYDYIIISGGVNNIYGANDVMTFSKDILTSFEDLAYTCKALSRFGDKVVLCNPFYFEGSVNDMEPKQAYKFREMIYEYAIEYGFSYIDLTKFEYERFDKIHPTPVGDIQIATRMFEILGEKQVI